MLIIQKYFSNYNILPKPKKLWWRWPESNRRPKVFWPGSYRLNWKLFSLKSCFPARPLFSQPRCCFIPQRRYQLRETNLLLTFSPHSRCQRENAAALSSQCHFVVGFYVLTDFLPSLRPTRACHPYLFTPVDTFSPPFNVSKQVSERVSE